MNHPVSFQYPARLIQLNIDSVEVLLQLRDIACSPAGFWKASLNETVSSWICLAWIVVAFIAIGGGVGCAGYGVARALLVSGPRLPEEVEWISKFIGGGVGATTVGIVLLVVALLRRKKEAGNVA
jgi:hypothetical protein